MTDDSKKPPKRDPFAPLPLSETLTGPTKKPRAPTAPAPAPEPPPPPPLPEPHVTVEVVPEVVVVDAAPAVEPVVVADVAPVVVEEPPPPVVPEPEPAWTEPASSLVAENELREAVGATPLTEAKKEKKKPKKSRASTELGDDDSDDDQPRNKLWMLVAALAVVLGGSIVAMILVGRSNSENLYLACEAKRAVILQGRSFPPWGTATLEGAEWKSFELPADAACVPLETKSKAELAEGFVKLLEERAKTLVGARGGKSTAIAAIDPEDPVAKVDEAEASLTQALLVTRHLVGDAAINKRNQLKRLLGDVTYWRASARLRAAATALDDAARQFDTAALQQPEANRDPDAWARLARRLADELRAGPTPYNTADLGMPPSDLGAPSEPTRTSTAPLGTALPVEPPPAVTEPTPTPDAAVPASSGGVLL